ncbi:hypothetical protein KCP73_14470 [Salmonella enterica subsp. enterica]|nr:hypothetical protein KCP73_14470 [Salmonella enterica subsp. enterica]
MMGPLALRSFLARRQFGGIGVLQATLRFSSGKLASRSFNRSAIPPRIRFFAVPVK